MKSLLWILGLVVLSACSQSYEMEDYQEPSGFNIYYTCNFLAEENFEDLVYEHFADDELEVNMNYFTDAIALMDHLLQSEESVDLIFGLDDIVYSLYDVSELFATVDPQYLKGIDKEFLIDRSNRLIPISYSYLAFIYNNHEIDKPPQTFGELQDGRWKNQIIITDVEQTAIGNAFLHWSISLFGQLGYGHFCRSLRDNVFTITNTWEDAYRKFLAGEAPLVLGLASQLIYHYGSDRYSAVVPQEGSFLITQNAAILDDSRNKDRAYLFLEHMLSREFQSKLYDTIYMYPTHKDSEILEEYMVESLPERAKPIRLRTIQRMNSHWVNRWNNLIHQ